jgi:hypothetical protein
MPKGSQWSTGRVHRTGHRNAKTTFSSPAVSSVNAATRRTRRRRTHGIKARSLIGQVVPSGRRPTTSSVSGRARSGARTSRSRKETLLIIDPLASIALGIELFGEQLRTGPGYVSGAVVSLAVLGAGVVMLSIGAPPVMTAEELARLPGHAPTSVKAGR